MSNFLLPELTDLVALVCPRPGPAQTTLQYSLAMALVQLGQAQRLSIVPGPGGGVAVFKMVTGRVFTVDRPGWSQGDEEEVMELVYEVLEEEGLVDGRAGRWGS